MDKMWLQYNNQRLKRADGSDDDGSGMDSSVLASTLLLTPSSAVTMSSSPVTSEFIGSGDFTSEPEGSGFSTSFSDITSIISFTSTVSPFSSSLIISSTVPIETSSPITRSINITLTTESSILVVSSTLDTGTVSSSEVTQVFTSIMTSEITPSFTVTSSEALSTTASVVLSSSITPSFVTPSFISPSFTMAINESTSIFTTVVVSSISITSAIVSRSILISSSDVSFSSQVAPSSVIVTSSPVSNTTSALFTSVISSENSIIPVTSTALFPTMITSSIANVTSQSPFISPSSSAEISSLISSTTTETLSVTIATSRGIDSTSVVVSSTFLVSTESIITTVTTSSLVFTNTPTSNVTMLPTIITTGVIESTSIAPSPTPPISSSTEIIPNTTIISFSEPSTPLRISTVSPVLPSTEIFTTSSFSSTEILSSTVIEVSSTTPLVSSVTSSLSSEVFSTITPVSVTSSAPVIPTINTTPMFSSAVPTTTLIPSSTVLSATSESSPTFSLTSVPSATIESSPTITLSLTSVLSSAEPSSAVPSATSESSPTITLSLTSVPSSAVPSATIESSPTITLSLTSVPSSAVPSATIESSPTITLSLTPVPSSAVPSATTEPNPTITFSLTSIPSSVTSDTTTVLSLTSSPTATSISIIDSASTMISSAPSSLETLTPTTEIIPTVTITSAIVESTLETSSSSFVASTSLMVSSTMSSIEISPTMTSRADITSMSLFTLTSATASIAESSFIPTPVSSTETVLSSSAIETVSETLVSTSVFPSSTVDTTTTVISSVEISPSLTSMSVVVTNSSTFTSVLSDTVSITSSTVPSSQFISTVETTSSIIIPSSTTDFIFSSTVTEVTSSTSLIPSSEVIQSSSFVLQTSSMFSISVVTITSSSMVMVPTSTTLMVSPTPTMLQCPVDTNFCEILMECILTTQECPDTPEAPIRASVEGPGFLINEINQNEGDNNQYTFKFGNFINAQMHGSDGKIVFNVGSRQDSVNYTIPPLQINYTNLTGQIIQKRVVPNETISVIVQAHNLNLFNTNEESLTIVVLGNDIEQDMCTINNKFGYCIGSFNASRDVSMIDISVMEKDKPMSRASIGQVEVIQLEEDTNLNPAIIIKLPTNTIYPPDDATVTVSSRGYHVKSLLLDCTLNDSSASIVAIPRPNWSTLSINNNDNRNQLAVSHERITDVEYESEEEILSMKVNFENYFTDWIEVKCEIVELLTVNGVLMESEDVNILVLDRDNTNSSSYHIFLTEDNVTYLIAYSNQTEIFNSAVINDQSLVVDLIVKGITVTGRVIDLDLSNLSCDSSNSSVLKIINCSAVMLDGTETAGSSSVTINVRYGSLHTTILFRVWYPERLVFKADDTILNVIVNWPDPDLNCTHKYQQTVFRVFANVSDGNTILNELDVTSYASGIAMSSNESVLKVFPNATVEGVSEGTADITIQNYHLSINVSNDPVRAAALEVMLFNNIDITIPEITNLYDDAYGTVTLAQKNDREKFLYVNVLFNDSQRMELDQSQFKIDNACEDNIAIRGNLIHPIGNTSGPRECIKVSLVRDETCSVSDSVEGMTNVSIQLSEPSHLVIIPSTYEVIADHEISEITSISTEITIQVILNFTNGDQIDVTLSNETTIITNLTTTRSSTDLIITASRDLKNTEYNLTATNSLYNISTTIMVNVVQNLGISLSAHPYPLYSGSFNVSENTLSRISSTDQYQQAILRVWLMLPNGSKYDVTDQASFTIPPDSVLIRSNDTVTVNGNMVNATENITGNITAQFNSLYSSITVQVTSQPVEVMSIGNISFTSECRGVLNSTRFVNVSVTLDDGTVLLNTYNGNDPLYPGLLGFNLTDNTSASIKGNTLTLLGNSLMTNTITAFATTSSNSYSKNFWCNLEAGLHDVDLGNNLGLPIDVAVHQSLMIPVHVNSENANLGIFELNVLYSSDELSIDNVIAGGDWTTGSLDYQITTMDENTDIVNFGGINYHGEQGKSIHVADIMFTPNAPGNVILNSTITLLAKADFNSTLLGRVDRNSIAGSSLMVNINQQKRRRETFYDEPPLMSPLTELNHHQHKRQNSEEFPAGDLNRDHRVDLRDVNYLRHYQVESVYNFSSENGQEILMTYNTTESLTEGLDINGDGQVNSLDITELEDISFDLLRIISNVTAICSADNGACSCTISGILSAADNQQLPSDDVFILVDFTSTNASFQDEFDRANFEIGTEVLGNKGNHSYGGIVQAAIDGNIFMVKTNYNFRTPDTGISLVQITVDTNGETSDERKSIHVRPGNIYPPLNISVSVGNINQNVNILIENHYSPLMNLTNDCPVISIPTTTLSATTVESTSTMAIMSSSVIDSSSTTSTSALSFTATESVTTTMTITNSTTILQTSNTVTSVTSEILNTTTPTIILSLSSIVISEASRISSSVIPSVTTTSDIITSILTVITTGGVTSFTTTSTMMVSLTAAEDTVSTGASTSTTTVPTSSIEASTSTTTVPTSSIEASTSTTTVPTSSIEASTSTTTVPTSSIEASTSTTTVPTSSIEASTSTTTVPTSSIEASTSTTTVPTSNIEASTSTTTVPTSSIDTSTSTTTVPTSSIEASTSTTTVPTTSIDTSTSITTVPTATIVTVSSTSTVMAENTTGIGTGTSATTVISSTSSMGVSGTMITRLSDASTTNIISPSVGTDDSGSSSGGGAGGVVAGVIVPIVVIVVVVTVIAVYLYRRSKRRKTFYIKQESRPSSGMSSNYWFQEEEKIVSIVIITCLLFSKYLLHSNFLYRDCYSSYLPFKDNIIALTHNQLVCVVCESTKQCSGVV